MPLMPCDYYSQLTYKVSYSYYTIIVFIIMYSITSSQHSVTLSGQSNASNDYDDIIPKNTKRKVRDGSLRKTTSHERSPPVLVTISNATK
jgi:hypothetical protein